MRQKSSMPSPRHSSPPAAFAQSSVAPQGWRQVPGVEVPPSSVAITSPSHAPTYTAVVAPRGAQSASAKQVRPRDSQFVHGISIGGRQPVTSMSFERLRTVRHSRPPAHMPVPSHGGMHTCSRTPIVSRSTHVPVNDPSVAAQSESELQPAHTAGAKPTQLPFAMSQIGPELGHAPGVPGAAVTVSSLQSTQRPVCGWQTCGVQSTPSQGPGGPESGGGPASGRVPVVQTPLAEHVSFGPQSVGAVQRA